MIEFDRPKAARRLAELVSQGLKGPKQLSIIQDEFKLHGHLTLRHLGSLKSLPEFQNYAAEQLTAVAEGNKAIAKLALSNLLPDAIAAIKTLLKKNDHKAAVTVFEATGVITKKDEGPKQDQILQVIMSGGNNEKTIDVGPSTAEGTRGIKP